MSDNSERLEALESHAAEQERTIRDLSDVVAEQWAEIDRLRRQVDQAKQQMDSLWHALERILPPDPPPPHY